MVSAVTLASLIASFRTSRRPPAYIIALVAGSLAAVLLGAEASGVAMFATLDAKRSCPWRVARCWQTPPFGRLPKPAVHHRRGALLVQVIVVIV